jgi:hypothetical protein
VTFDFLARALASILVTAIAALGLSTAAGAVTPVPGCASFVSQAGAQDYFGRYGGNPRHPVGNLDPDRNGIACEGLSGPYKAYATIGYNRKGHFFYGVASMPPAINGGEEFPCLYGNRVFPDGPRRLNVYKVQPGADKPIFGALKAEAKPEVGHLLWKADRDVVTPGHYYVAFEERIPLKPYGANECPGFRSAEAAFPRPSRQPVVS